MATLAIPKQENKQELGEILEKAVDLHGHLGPFLVLGIRMGLIGLRELGTKRGNQKLRVTVLTKPSVPFSCVLDGVQASTKCTIGNRKLKLRNSLRTVSAKFQILEVNTVTVTLYPAKREELEKLLLKHVGFQEVEKIAHNVISIPERELFKVEKK